MAEEQPSARPHLQFTKLDLERPRHRRPAPVSRPRRDNEAYGRELEIAVKSLGEDFEEATAQQPPQFDPACIFRIKLDLGQVDEAEWQRSGLTLLSEEPGNVVVLFSEDQLAAFAERVGKYAEPLPEGRAAPTYSWIASITTDMKLWNRDDRRGPKLSGIRVEPDNTYSVDVDLWHYGARAEWEARLEELRLYVSAESGQFLNSYVGSSLSVARVRITGDALERLLDVGIVQSVDLPPQPDLGIGQLLQTPLDQFQAPVKPPPAGASSVCVIDSGIATGHPLLGPCVGDTAPIPASLGSGLDQHGHGTKVAGIAVYGDVRACIQSLNFSPEIFVFGARVTNQNNKFDDEKLIVRQMDDSIRYFHKTYGCKIFNISLADPKLVYAGAKPSPWAQVLDTLAHELDVLIVVSAGNLPVAGAVGADADRVRADYPRYLLEPGSRILEPATAANVLTVGSLAVRAAPRDLARYPNDPSIPRLRPSTSRHPLRGADPAFATRLNPTFVSTVVMSRGTGI